MLHLGLTHEQAFSCPKASISIAMDIFIPETGGINDNCGSGFFSSRSRPDDLSKPQVLQSRPAPGPLYSRTKRPSSSSMPIWEFDNNRIISGHATSSSSSSPGSPSISG